MPKQKLDKLKEKIHYMKESPRCGNCKYYEETRSKKKLRHYPYTTYTIHRRCTLFDFATRPNAVCLSDWKAKEDNLL